MQSSFWTQKGRAGLTRVPDGIGVFPTCEGPQDCQFCAFPQRIRSPVSGLFCCGITSKGSFFAFNFENCDLVSGMIRGSRKGMEETGRKGRIIS